MTRKLSIEELNRISIDEFKKETKVSLTIVLENIRSLNNVGSVFRTADAFKLERIILCGITGKPPHKEIRKTALGATDSVDWEHYENPVNVVEKLRNEGYSLISVEQCEGSTELTNFEVSKNGKYALIFGNEVEGVSQQLIDLSDTCVEIPQYGTKHSLNVSVCAGIVIWEFFRKMY